MSEALGWLLRLGGRCSESAAARRVGRCLAGLARCWVACLVCGAQPDSVATGRLTQAGTRSYARAAKLTAAVPVRQAPAQYTQPQFVTVTGAGGARALRLPAAAQRLGPCIIVVLQAARARARPLRASGCGRAQHCVLRLKSKFCLCWPASAFQVQLEVEFTEQPALQEATARLAVALYRCSSSGRNARDHHDDSVTQCH
jgi:hypothetical protein